jgi:hypothetical protein
VDGGAGQQQGRGDALFVAFDRLHQRCSSLPVAGVDVSVTVGISCSG